jgi:GH15 family glucan-1,4-alpha-glucosidase
VMLHGSHPVHGEGLTSAAEFSVKRGERAWFTLTYGDSTRPAPARIDVEQALEDTLGFWTEWTGRMLYKGPHADAVERSLITLKAMTFRPSGGVVAAPTTSLPEQMGGTRNWDYRYCWLRDTTFTLLALARAGYFEEAGAWQDWLLRAVAGSPDQVQIMYGLKGERQLIEWEAPWLEGYEQSRPVRVGNAAAGQVQLDIYGEMLGTFHMALHRVGRHRREHFRVLVLLLKHLEKIWDEPDAGIWEMRGGLRHFTYSKVMAWVAFDRALKIAEMLGEEVATKKWAALRDRIHEQVCARGFHRKKNCFVQYYGSQELDASLLLMPMVGFLPFSDERVQGTIAAIERELMRDGLVMRYPTQRVKDGLPPGEGMFLACSFWMVSCLKAMGRERDAQKLFERLLKLRNDVGLLAEEYDTARKRMSGNFPQAFSHIALVNAAFWLAGANGPLGREHTQAEEAAAR